MGKRKKETIYEYTTRKRRRIKGRKGEKKKNKDTVGALDEGSQTEAEKHDDRFTCVGTFQCKRHSC